MMDLFARKMWAAGIWFAISLIVLVVGLKVFSMHRWPTCPDRVISQAANPGKTWVAAILQRRCGPESEFSTRVNVRPAGPLHTGFFSSQAAKGNVFVLREDAAGAKISVSWAANNLLRVRCLHCPASLIGQRDQVWGDVKIEYEFP